MSELQNLINSLYGPYTKTTVPGTGRAIWGPLCDPNSNGLPCFPRIAGEGLICYFLRVLSSIGTFSATVHNVSISYCKNTMVASGSSLYVAIQAVPAGVSIANGAYWLLLITAPPGVAGPQGVPGASGAGSAVNYAQRTTASDTALSDTDAVLFCEPAAPTNITIPLMSTLLPGKWFTIWTNGAFAVTITPTGPDTIDDAATFVMSTPYQAIDIVSNNAGKWRIK